MAKEEKADSVDKTLKAVEDIKKAAKDLSALAADTVIEAEFTEVKVPKKETKKTVSKPENEFPVFSKLIKPINDYHDEYMKRKTTGLFVPVRVNI